MFPYGETVTRLRATTVTDPYSGEETGKSWTDPNIALIEGCAFNPGDSTEPLQDARQSVITRPTVYAPYNADIAAADRLVVRGTTYEVDGRPLPWKSPFTGWTPGLEIKLKDVEG
jgi:hypothetical protein